MENFVMRTRVKRGFSLIDVIAICAIVSILAMLLLPATRQARESARRSQCKNNLKQLALALHNYEELFKTLPPGVVNAPSHPGASHGKNMLSWNHMILAQLDGGPLASMFVREKSILEAPNVELVATIQPNLRCPTDIGPVQADNIGTRGRVGGSIPNQGTTNYVGCFGVGIPVGAFNVDLNPVCQGVFGQNSVVRINDIKDGTSNVFLLGERRMGRSCTSWNSNRTTGQGYIGADGDPAKLTPHKTVGNFCSYWAGIEQEEDLVEILGTTTEGVPHEDRIPGQTIKINTSVIPGTRIRLHENDTTIGFNSYHLGGAHFAIGDGTIRFISEDIDEATYQNLSRRSDGAELGPF
jgi:type II secretory pathway pseudopilin PulG